MPHENILYVGTTLLTTNQPTNLHRGDETVVGGVVRLSEGAQSGEREEDEGAGQVEGDGHDPSEVERGPHLQAPVPERRQHRRAAQQQHQSQLQHAHS